MVVLVVAVLVAVVVVVVAVVVVVGGGSVVVSWDMWGVPTFREECLKPQCAFELVGDEVGELVSDDFLPNYTHSRLGCQAAAFFSALSFFSLSLAWTLFAGFGPLVM